MSKKKIDSLVSVVLLNWNTPEMTIECINSVLKSDYSNFKVNVVDNGSKDNSYSIIKNMFQNKLKVFSIEENIGYAMGMNYALKKAAKQHPDYFLIINNDTVIAKDAISHLVEVAKRFNNECVVTGKVYHFYDQNRLQTVGDNFDREKINSQKIGYNEIDIGQYETEEVREMVDDIFLLLPIKAYLSSNGYSSYFYMNYEQTDLILRLIDFGYHAVYSPKAKLWHKGSFSTGGIGNPYMMFWEGKSKIIIHRLYQNDIEFLEFYLADLGKVLWGLGKGIVGTMFGKTKNLRARFALLRGLISGTVWLFNRKEESGYNPYGD